MLQFILGVLVGAIIGFITCAICSMAGADEHTKTRVGKETGEKDAESK